MPAWTASDSGSGSSDIITDHHLKLHITNVEGELVTPTGAAIAAALRTRNSSRSSL